MRGKKECGRELIISQPQFNFTHRYYKTIKDSSNDSDIEKLQ